MTFHNKQTFETTYSPASDSITTIVTQSQLFGETWCVFVEFTKPTSGFQIPVTIITGLSITVTYDSDLSDVLITDDWER